MIRGFLTARRLSKRERIALPVIAGLLGVFIFVQFVLIPISDKRARLNRVLVFKTGVLKKMHQLKADYNAIQQNSAQIEEQYSRRPKGFSLFAFLDKLARDSGIKDNIAYMKPSSGVQKENSLKIAMVEMKIQAVSLRQLTDYLYRIETSENMVTIQRASFVRKGKDQKALDVVLQVQTMEI